eukprot:scaffold7504_cov277-Pinguiococcus_pyrenoidosus.AAC.2
MATTPTSRLRHLARGNNDRFRFPDSRTVPKAGKWWGESTYTSAAITIEMESSDAAKKGPNCAFSRIVGAAVA